MKIKYSINRLDTACCAVSYMVYNPSLRMMLKVQISVFCFFVILRGFMQFINSDNVNLKNCLIIFLPMLLIPIGFAFFMIILVALGTFFEHLLIFKKGILGDHELEVGPEGLWERTTYNNTLHEWNSVCAVYENAYFYFIRVHIPAPSVHGVPKNGCVVRDDLDTFIEKVRDGIRDSEHLRDKRGKPL